MLGRVANGIFWMYRYLERAENMARMIDAHHRLSLLPRPPEVVAFGPQRLVRVGPKLERHPLDLDILPPHRLL